MSSRDPAAALLTQAASTHGGCFVGKSMSRPELALAVEIEQVRGENIRLKTASSIVQGALTQVSAACEAERDGFKLALEREREALRTERQEHAASAEEVARLKQEISEVNFILHTLTAPLLLTLTPNHVFICRLNETVDCCSEVPREF